MTISRTSSYVSLKILLFTEEGKPLGLLEGKDGIPHVVQTLKTEKGNLDFGINPNDKTHFYYGSLEGKKIFYLFLYYEEGGERAQFPLHPKTKTPIFPTLQERTVFPKDFEGELIWPKDKKGIPSFPCTKTGFLITPLDRKGRAISDPFFGEREYFSFLRRKIEKEGSCKVFQGSFSRKSFQEWADNFPVILQVRSAFVFRKKRNIEIPSFPKVKKALLQYCRGAFSLYGTSEKEVEEEDGSSFVIFSITSFSVKEGHFLDEMCEETDQKEQ